VHQAGHDPVEQLRLAEDDRGLVAQPAGRVRRPVGGRRAADEPREEQRAPGEEPAGDDEQRGEAERAADDVYEPRAFRSSALIAGTISWRSPITA
jgi:hypothetical protein